MSVAVVSREGSSPLISRSCAQEVSRFLERYLVDIALRIIGVIVASVGIYAHEADVGAGGKGVKVVGEGNPGMYRAEVVTIGVSEGSVLMSVHQPPPIAVQLKANLI